MDLFVFSFFLKEQIQSDAPVGTPLDRPSPQICCLLAPHTVLSISADKKSISEDPVIAAALVFEVNCVIATTDAAVPQTGADPPPPPPKKPNQQ